MLKNILFILTASLLLIACRPTPQTQLHTLSGQTMGTSYTVKYHAPANQRLPESQEVQQQINDILAQINREMSTYDPQSTISQFNQRTAKQGAMPIEADFATVLAEAIRLNHISDGALDVTVGPIVNLWGFGPDKTAIEPTSQQLAAAEKIVGLDKLIFRQPENGQAATLAKTADGVYLDLSAIAKGFAVDKLAQHLEQLGIEDYLVEIGGELRGKGHNPQGKAWRVGIEQPDFAQQHHSQIIVSLNHRALATSGDYRNFRVDGQGKRQSHIINPKTKQPISHQLASVSVIADNAMTADGLATALYVLGQTEAMRLAEREQWAVFFVIKTEHGFASKMSSEFKKIAIESDD